MNRKNILTFFLMVPAFALCATAALAQGSRDYHRMEFAIGYSHMRAESTVGTEILPVPGGTVTLDPCTTQGAAFFGANFQKFFCDRRGYNGFDASVTFNFHRYIGLQGNVSGHFNSETFVDGATNVDSRVHIYNFLAGIQLKDNRRESRALKPFAHALFGVARVTIDTRQTNQFAPPPFNDFPVTDGQNSFAMKLGGGLDLRLSRRIDLRLVEFNYNPIFAGERQLVGGPFPQTPIVAKGRTAQNFTIGFGVVFH